MVKRIVLLGGPGAGKGTQAARIAEREGLSHVSTGEMFRAQANSGTELGRQIGALINQGGLVPDNLTMKIVDERLLQDDCARGYILDGFPRTIAQAEVLDALLSQRGEDIHVAIELHVDDDETVRRLTARRSCPQCNKIYNLVFSPPLHDELCDNCPSVALVQREDDSEPTIRRRLKVYHAQTEPILDYYRESGLLRVIDGARDPDDIALKVQETLDAIGVS